MFCFAIKVARGQTQNSQRKITYPWPPPPPPPLPPAPPNAPGAVIESPDLS